MSYTSWHYERDKERLRVKGDFSTIYFNNAETVDITNKRKFTIFPQDSIGSMFS